MNKGKTIIAIVFVSILFHISCRNGDRVNRNLKLSIERKKVEEKISPMGEVVGYEALQGKGNFLMWDKRPQIFVFSNYEQVGRVGSRGSGRCEYQRPVYVDIYKRKIYVLDVNNSKIIEYSVDSYKCVEDYFGRNISKMHGISKNKEGIYLIRGLISSMSPDSMNILYKFIRERNKAKPVPGATVGDIKKDLLKAPNRSTQPTCSLRESLLFKTSMGNTIWRYDYNTGEASELFRVGEYERGGKEGINDPLRAIRNMDITMEMGCEDNKIFTASMRSNSQKRWQVRYYNKKGKILKKKNLSSNVIGSRGVNVKAIAIKEEYKKYPIRLVTIDVNMTE